MIDCSEFLAGYSDYRDGLGSAEIRAALVAHLEGCSACSRYDRVIAGGLDVLLNLPEVDASPDFQLRLEKRLEEIDRHPLSDSYASGAPVGLTVAIAVAIGAAAWLPLMRPDREPFVLPAAVAHAPDHPQLLPVRWNPAMFAERAPIAARQAALFRTGDDVAIALSLAPRGGPAAMRFPR